VINPQTISLAGATVGMLLIALMGVGEFTVLAQRRLRAIGMLGAQGATDSHIRLVVQVNGAVTGRWAHWPGWSWALRPGWLTGPGLSRAPIT
jgi:hypothetical protein